ISVQEEGRVSGGTSM
nr:immunoglobulin heavy chain junction region [Mus musculus]